jgi:hypothetical protein
MDDDEIFSYRHYSVRQEQSDSQQRIQDGSRYIDTSNAILHGIHYIDDNPMTQWARDDVYRRACKDEDEMRWTKYEPSGR